MKKQFLILVMLGCMPIIQARGPVLISLLERLGVYTRSCKMSICRLYANGEGLADTTALFPQSFSGYRLSPGETLIFSSDDQDLLITLEDRYGSLKQVIVKMGTEYSVKHPKHALGMLYVEIEQN